MFPETAASSVSQAYQFTRQIRTGRRWRPGRPEISLSHPPPSSAAAPSATGPLTRCTLESGVGKDDVLIVISNSGRNAVPVEMAQEAQLRAIPVIVVTSLSYLREVPARQAGGKDCTRSRRRPRQLHSLRGRGRQPSGASQPVGPYPRSRVRLYCTWSGWG